MKKKKEDTPILSFDYEKGRFNYEYLVVEGETLEDATEAKRASGKNNWSIRVDKYHSSGTMRV